MPTVWLTDEQQCAWRGLMLMNAQLGARINQELQRTSGLSAADYEVLVLLSESPEPGLRMFAFVAQLQWEQSRVSHQIARMQRRGLVDRRECPTDRRGSVVVLTDAGRTALEQAAPAHVDLVRSVLFDDVSPAEVASLRSMTARVLDRLERYSEPATAAGTTAVD